MNVSVVCISHTDGSLGVELGEVVAERLGFRRVDEEIILTAAANENLEPELLADAERRRSFVERIVERMAVGGIVDAVAGPLEVPPGGEQLRDAIREAIRETANEGSVVIVSHGAAMALAGLPGLLRVLVTASPEMRARRLAGDDVIADLEELEHRIRESDKGRAAYFQQFYGIDEELPIHYDVVLNTTVLTLEDAAAIVVTAAGR